MHTLQMNDEEREIVEAVLRQAHQLHVKAANMDRRRRTIIGDLADRVRRDA